MISMSAKTNVFNSVKKEIAIPMSLKCMKLKKKNIYILRF